MTLLSVITAVHRPEPEHLLAAWESLRDQVLPPGWAWEWVVQEDGRTGAARAVLPADDRIRHGDGPFGGVALTKNHALGRSSGVLVKNLDADDVLAPGVLARDVAALEGDPDLHWTASPVLDLLPDGSTVGADADPPPGRVEPGFVFGHWCRNDYRLPMHPTTICIRRQLLVTLGGWMGVYGSDDTGMFLPASTLATGWFHAEVGLLYRKWPGQVTAAPEHTDPGGRRHRMELIRERTEYLRRSS